MKDPCPPPPLSFKAFLGREGGGTGEGEEGWGWGYTGGVYGGRVRGTDLVSYCGLNAYPLDTHTQTAEGGLAAPLSFPPFGGVC